MGQGQNKNLETNSIEVKIIVVPSEGKPVDFTGSTGDFKIKSSIDKQNVKTNEPVTLTVIVSGINFNAYDGFDKYDTIIANTNDNSKEFKTIFISLVPGEKEIPATSLSFF